MADIIQTLQSTQDCICGHGVEEAEIQQAEMELEVKFAEDYYQYLLHFGLVAYDGHELTGITKSKRLNVVDVTKKARQYTANVPDDWYVIEETNIDGIVIWQSSEGAIYQTQPGHTLAMICKSLSEYIDL